MALHHHTHSRKNYTPQPDRCTPKVWSTGNEGATVPFPELSLSWMTNMRKPLVYAATDMSFERRVGAYLLKKNAHFLEEYHVNRLYETIVGELLHEYFLKNDRTITVHIASSHDDFFSGSDFIITKGLQSVRIDLSLGNGRIHSFEENYSLKSIGNKVQKFHESAGIPEEYFAAIKGDVLPIPLPLIILRIDCSILKSFARDFFEIMAHEKTNIDILDYFGEWMNNNTNIVEERVAYILGLINNPNESECVNKLTMQIGNLFAGIDPHSIHTVS